MGLISFHTLRVAFHGILPLPQKVAYVDRLQTFALRIRLDRLCFHSSRSAALR